jgi:hypothetical protein
MKTGDSIKFDDITIINPDQWSSYDRRIWGSFEETIDGIFLGACPYPEAQNIGHWQGRPVLVARRVTDQDGDFLTHTDFTEGESPQVRFNVSTALFVYPEDDGSDLPAYEDMFEGVFRPLDGSYDILRDHIPESLRFCVEMMYPTSGEIDKAITKNFIQENLNGIDNIADPWVRRWFENLLG